MGRIVAQEPGLFDIDARLRELSAKGDDLERVNALVDFEAFRPSSSTRSRARIGRRAAARPTTMC
jgi:hypothetical protein